MRRDLLQWAFWLQTPPPQPPVGADTALQDAVDRIATLVKDLDAGCTLSRLPPRADEIAAQIDRLLRELPESNGHRETAEALREKLMPLRQAAEKSAEAARRQIRKIHALMELCKQFEMMDFHFLFDPGRKLLTVGFDVSEHRRDESYYDLLASEARLASFLAVAHRQLPKEHWFALGRMVAVAGGKPVLLSWCGSMFEYLMPMLMMPSYPGTVLHESCRNAVRQQMRYAQSARRALGDIGKLLQHDRCRFRIPVSRLRRAGIGARARFGR